MDLCCFLWFSFFPFLVAFFLATHERYFGVHGFFLESHSKLDLENYPFNLNSLYEY